MSKGPWVLGLLLSPRTVSACPLEPGEFPVPPCASGRDVSPHPISLARYSLYLCSPSGQVKQVAGSALPRQKPSPVLRMSLGPLALDTPARNSE